MTRPPGGVLVLGPDTADKLDRYFATTAGSARTTWEASGAHRILQSFRALATGLEQVQQSAPGSLALDGCQAEWDAAERDIGALLHALADAGSGDAARQTRVVQSSRRAVQSLRQCVVRLAGGAEASVASEAAVAALTGTLHAAAIEVGQLHTELSGATEAQPRGHAAEVQPAHRSNRAVQHSLPEVLPAHRSGGSEDAQVAHGALALAATLAEQLRAFVRASSRPGWAAARSQLAHQPSVPSPLASGGSTLHHRRWVSEELEAEPAAAKATGGRLSEAGPRHTRNRSDSRTLPQPAQAPDAAERAKQVRFQPAPLGEPPVDQARLAELVQLLAQFEAATAALEAAVAGGAGASAAARGVVTAFVQLSRLSSASGLVKHYDKAVLAQFKTTTQAVKRLMAHSWQ
ncbi:hypothetical protein H4S01_005029 [Coemansia sp. RSA 2610]|nr:hypothetical protein H4S01_005029 [Coemansia sp. RSA 2610]